MLRGRFRRIIPINPIAKTPTFIRLETESPADSLEKQFAKRLFDVRRNVESIGHFASRFRGQSSLDY